MSATHSVQSIQDVHLGLTQGELQMLRQQQQVMAQRSHQDSRPADRGRGTSRHSQPSSRAASAASSQPGNRILLDPQYLRSLQAHLDNVLAAIQNRISELEEATEQATSVRSERHRRTEAEAERAIERVRALLKSIDHLEEELTKITKIKEVVKKLKQRVDETHERVERSSASRHTDSRHTDSRHTDSRHPDSRHPDSRHGDSRGGDRSSSVRHADLAYRPRDRHR